MDQFIAVLGGDGRYLELIRQLQQMPNTTIFLVGFDKLEQGFTGLKQVDFHDLEPEKLDAVVLPITGTNQNGEIETVFSDQQIKLTKDWFQKLRPSTLIFTGITNDYLTSLTNELNLQLTALFDRDDVAIYNSIPTAEGTIMMAIEHTDYTIHSSRVIVVGFGRVGNTVANKFSALGAKVSVCARSIKDLARITEMGLTAIPLDDLPKHTEACDLLINTIPAFVIKKDSIQQLPSHALIFDLASKPGGTDFEYAEKRGIKAILSRSLPGIVAPKTSGKILADVIKQFLQNGKERA
ncbi:dipicolinic acid synthetase subunit A [Virgibacillus dakarensis]|uniref:Dipicolinate synthase subunit A n=1 Tax=Lentibacillus populi TaxID=1827502 RepID=A0A9W5TUE9_9BACI|nr:MULTISPECIES: dipicolinic acid synthetase subunit A [Bacillaceae]MBT2215060.1 dipicolinic acid synthetase subunit A [Virgibacillus dakarensis]MTW84931.1 dipicolinic acid synthetase subunit A [Virgibacillus dakarensis]GGB30712.1 dipicolinate synthase subunit A [Lentibacillus populi]